jgi:polysaccharide biosynthesis protein PslG
LRFAGILLGVVLVLAALVYLNQNTIRRTLAHWTGEEDLYEQVKGTVALAYLTLTSRPPQTDPFVPIAHTDVSPYGVNTFLEQEVEESKVDQSLRLIQEAGFHWIRQEFPWESIELSAKGDYWDHKWNVSGWAKYDRIVNLASKYGLEIIARLDHPPAWTRKVGNAEGTMAPPDNYEDFGDFVYAVVSRYKGRVHYYQIWNEPNIYPEWGDHPADPAGYVKLLQIAYRRAKEADPDCLIIAAGLAQTTEETPPEFGPRNVSDVTYLEKMYQAGVKGHFDIMGAMVYGLWTGPYDRRLSRDRANFSRVQYIREIMVRHGDGNKAIWATEVGWNAVPASFADAPYGRVSEDQQAVYAVEAYERAAREWPWMGVMNYWFLRRASDAEANQSWYYFRMLEPDFTPLPVYGALGWLANQVPAVPIGYHQEDHWALNYSGTWQHLSDAKAVLGGYALGKQGAGLDFNFSGTDLALVLHDARQVNHLRIVIDGREMRASYTWSAPRFDSVSITVARHLKDTRHQVQIYVREDEVALDGLIVWRSQPNRLGWITGSIGFVLAAIVILAVCRRLGQRDRDGQ